MVDERSEEAVVPADFSSEPPSGDTLEYKLRGAKFCASVRAFLQYNAYPLVASYVCTKPALRPLRGLAHGLPYPAHFGANSHDVTWHKKIRWTA